jgi:signal transduction histidine kinase
MDILEDLESIETVLSHQRLRQALTESVQKACTLLRMDGSVVFFINRTGNFSSLVCYGCVAEQVTIPARSEFLQAFDTEGHSLLSIERDKPAWRDLAAFMNEMQWNDGYVLPLLANGKMVGMWLVAWRKRWVLEKTDELILQTLAENISLLVQRMFLFAENQRFKRETRALYEISMEISQLLDLNRVLEVIVEKTCLLLNAEISYLALANEEEKSVQVCVTYGTRGDALRNLRHRYGEGVGGWVAANRSPLLVRNYFRDVRPQPPGIPEILASEGIISAICVPMCTRRGLVGVLYAASRQEAAFNRSQLELLQALGNQAAVAIENARLYDEQKALAEKLRNSIINHERLLALVLGNQGLQAITDTLSDLVRCPIIVKDSQFRTLARSSKGCECLIPEANVELRTLFAEFDDLFEIPEYAKTLRSNHHGIRIRPRSESGRHLSCIAVPIVGGKALLGYVFALEMGRSLNEQQRATVEEASIVFAIEFLKQEAVRTGLLHHIIAAQEEERKRIARELHDETSQALTALVLGLDTIGLDMGTNPEEAARRLQVTKSIAEGMLENIHRLISDLRPSLLDDLGLVPAIAWYGEQRLKPLGIHFHLESNGLDQRLPPAMEIALYRITQEAITNAIRHAQASKVIVRLFHQENRLTLQVEDDGIGFEPQVLQSGEIPEKSWGLWGMQERVSTLKGEFSVMSAPGKGTTIVVQVPLQLAEE